MCQANAFNEVFGSHLAVLAGLPSAAVRVVGRHQPLFHSIKAAVYAVTPREYADKVRAFALLLWNQSNFFFSLQCMFRFVGFVLIFTKQPNRQVRRTFQFMQLLLFEFVRGVRVPHTCSPK